MAVVSHHRKLRLIARELGAGFAPNLFTLLVAGWLEVIPRIIAFSLAGGMIIALVLAMWIAERRINHPWTVLSFIFPTICLIWVGTGSPYRFHGLVTGGLLLAGVICTWAPRLIARFRRQAG